MIGIPLVSRSGLVEEDAVEVFYYHGWHFYSFFLDVKFPSPFRENNNVVVLPFPFRSSALREGRWHLVMGESISRDSLGPLLC